MRKRIVLYSMLLALVFVSCKSSGGGEYDSRAVDVLDKLTETIGDLSACSYTLSSYESDKNGVEIEKLSDTYLKGPNKLFVENTGPNGRRNFWYNGEKFSYFLYNENEYDILDAPENTLALIDSIHNTYGIHFPAADFLYPTLTDDILENFDELLFFGEENDNGIDCVLLEATNENQIVGIWIEKETNLPHKMTIQSVEHENEYYEAFYSNWKLNPKLPDVMFEFQPPKGSVKKELKTK